MLSLLKIDLRKIFKSVFLLIAIGVAVGFPFFIMGLSASGVESTGIDGSELLAPQMIDFAFSPMFITGLMLPVFGAVLIGMDFAGGMVRNKIIAGNSKTNIYLSHLISTSIFYVLIAFLSFGGYVLAGQIFFHAFDTIDVDVLIWFLVSGLISYIFMASMSVLLTSLTKNVVSIPFVVILDLVLGVAVTVLPIIEALMVQSDGSTLPDIVYLIPLYGVTVTRILTTTQKVLTIVTAILFTAINTLIGILCFKKTDIK